jgi:hypothetical protein
MRALEAQPRSASEPSIVGERSESQLTWRSRFTFMT